MKGQRLRVKKRVKKREKLGIEKIKGQEKGGKRNWGKKVFLFF